MSASSKSRRNSILIAMLVAAVFVGWLLSGVVGVATEREEIVRSSNHMDDPVAVRIMHSRAQPTQRQILASARTEADRVIEIKSETEGRVNRIGAERGALVTTNQLLVELEMRDRNARLAEIDALIRQRELEYESAERLLAERFISPTELAAREAALESALAARERIVLDIEYTKIRAPFDAVVYDRLVEIGDYLGAGDPVAQLMDSDPLIVVADINERDIAAIKVGDIGKAHLMNGDIVEGRFRYLAPAADESTRSFRVELAVPNPGMSVPVGTSARLEFSADSHLTHQLPPSILWLADDGTVGVKIVDSTNRARFIPVEITDSTAEFMFVTGLPAEARVITVGQAYVVDGQAVSLPE